MGGGHAHYIRRLGGKEVSQVKYIPHDYQRRAEDFLIKTPRACLFLEMGLGKTVTVLSAFNKLRYDNYETQAMLIVAPLRVVQLVWRQEAEKWDHTDHLSVRLLHGKDKGSEIEKHADIYLVNYDGLGWLRKQLQTKKGKEFFKRIDMVVFDEATAIKNPKAQRSKTAVLLAKSVKRCCILTGSPTPNSLLDIWHPVYTVDGGERLERSMYFFRNKYFMSTGYGGYTYKPKKGAKERITSEIADISLAMCTEDYLSLPPLVVQDVFQELPASLRARHDRLEKEFLIELTGRGDLNIDVAAVSMKLRQYLQGFLYVQAEEGTPDMIEDVHDIKTKMLRDIVDQSGGSVLVAFQFRHELEKIRKEFGNVPAIYGGSKSNDVAQTFKAWGSGEVPILACHPASVAHGVNLQSGGNVLVWLGGSYSLEQYAQFNARLYRQGQKKTVFIYHLLIEGTLDGVMSQAVRQKDANQKTVMAAIKNYAEEKA